MCLHVMPMWQHLVEDLHPIGINLVTVNYDREVNLAQKLGARRAELPHISLVMESRVSSYKGDEYNTVKIIGKLLFKELCCLFLKTMFSCI